MSSNFGMRPTGKRKTLTVSQKSEISAMKSFVASQFPKTGQRAFSPQATFLTSGKTTAQMRHTAAQKGIPQQYVGVRSFPGFAKGVSGVQDGTPGRFVQSIKGMKGKHYIEKALTMTENNFFNGAE